MDTTLAAVQRRIRTNVFVHCLVLIVSFSCNAQSGEGVETRAKVAPHQIPAFKEQNRTAAVKTTTGFNFKIITEGLSSPWGLDFFPDGRMIVSERKGAIRIVEKDGKLGEALKNVPAVMFKAVSGMTDVKLSPDFQKSRFVFWTYVEPVGQEKAVNCVARGKLSADEKSLEAVQIIYRTSVPYADAFHTGSRILFDKQGYMLVTLGDRYTDDVRVQAQELNSPLGKIIRINHNGEPAPGNPFASTSGALKEIWSWGHRNPQGLAFNPITGDLWESEHGPKSGDEINIIKAGANYGWPIIAYGMEDNGNPVNGTGLTQKDGMEQPIYYWDPSIAPSGMTFYTGNLIPEWKNNLFIGSLRGSHIVRLVIDQKTNHIIGEERLLSDEYQRFRHIVQGPDEALYAITDQGRIYRIGK